MKKSLVLLVVLLAACEVDNGAADNEQVTNRGEGKDQWWTALPREVWAGFQKIEQSQNWFEVYEVAAGVYAIYEPGQFEEVISYLITGSNAALLFDTGLGIGDMGQLIGELTDLEVTVINSHTHYDHIGGNHGFKSILGVDTEYTRKRTAGLAHNEVDFAVGPGWIWKPVPVGFDPEEYAIEPYKVTRRVTDGERIILGADRQLEVILTPGHAPDALCLIDRKNRILFTGDTFYLAPLYTHLEGSDFDAYVTTAQRLAGLASDVDLLMPGHNEPAVAASYLPRLSAAFDEIVDNQADYIVTDGNREYAFGGFSIITTQR
ncbi:MAG: MBL fold metallo-hydrolase [Gammaproteobacteria bacterium]|nr:MBL fold metallo-hydrolase [Gammaproteobacteria bacterium]